MRGILGLAGYYRRFVKDYASIAAPLSDLLCRNGFTWSERAQTAFESLKSTLSATPILCLPDFNDNFVVEIDASGFAMGAVLTQQSHPIAYFSKKFSPRIRDGSAYVKEMVAVVEAIKKFRHYLLGKHFTIVTDHNSLRHLLTQRVQTPEQQRYLRHLLGYDYKIVYRPGRCNQVADALSRKENPHKEGNYPDTNDDAQLQVLSSPTSPLLDQIRNCSKSDDNY